MRLRTLTYSALFHIAILTVAAVGLPHLSNRDIMLPPPMMVELVEIAEKTQTTERAKPKPVKPKPPKEKPKPPPAKPKPPESKPKPAPKSSGEKPKPEPKETVPPLEKPKEEKKTDPKPKEEKVEEDFTSVLKNLSLDDEKPEPDTAEEESAIADLGTRMTMSEQDALRHQLEGCWNVPIGAKGVEDMSVEIAMDINPDRTLRRAVILDQNRYNRDSFFRAVADSAIRAVHNPSCSPFQLPSDKYDTWKRTIVNFNPKNMF